MTENIRYLNRINQLSEDDMRDYVTLHRLLELEMSKPPKDMDLDLIDECFAQIDELAGEGPKHSSAVIQTKIKAILGTPVSKASRTSKKSRPIAATDTKNRHRVRNFFIILAASLVLLYSSLTIAAKVQGYDNAWDLISQKFIEIFNLDSGEALEEGNITLVMDGNHIQYSSISQLLIAENLDIMYPSELPSNITITAVQKIVRDDSSVSYLFMFSNNNLSMVVNDHYSFDISTVSNYEEQNYGDYMFYVKTLKNGNCQAICHHNGYEYLITGDDYTHLLQIISNMKGSSL